MAGSKTSASPCDRALVKRRRTPRPQRTSHTPCLHMLPTWEYPPATGLTRSQAAWGTRPPRTPPEDQGRAVRSTTPAAGPILLPLRLHTHGRGVARRKATAVAIKAGHTRPTQSAPLFSPEFARTRPSQGSSSIPRTSTMRLLSPIRCSPLASYVIELFSIRVRNIFVFVGFRTSTLR